MDIFFLFLAAEIIIIDISGIDPNIPKRIYDDRKLLIPKMYEIIVEEFIILYDATIITNKDKRPKKYEYSVLEYSAISPLSSSFLTLDI